MNCNHRFDMEGIAEDLVCELNYGHRDEHKSQQNLMDNSFTVSWESTDLYDYLVEAS